MADETTLPDGGDNWRDSLSEDLRDSECLKPFATQEEAIKGLVSVQPLIGWKLIRPKDADDAEGWDNLRKELGRPDTAEGYQFPTEGMPFELPEGDANELKAMAHELGLNPNDAAKMARIYSEKVANGQVAMKAEMEKARADGEAGLRDEWGSAYDQNIKLAEVALGKYGTEEGVAALQEMGVGNSPEIMKMFAGIGRALASDEVLGGGSRKNFIPSPAEAVANRDAKLTDPDFVEAMNDKGHIRHKETVKIWAELNKAVAETL